MDEKETSDESKAKAWLIFEHFERCPYDWDGKDRELLQQVIRGRPWQFTQSNAEPARSRWPATSRPADPLRSCGTLICGDCRGHGPSPHRESCAALPFEACGSHWFWLSAHAAIKCISCAPPDSLSLVEGWVLARETDEGDSIPEEIRALLLALEGN